MIFGYIWQIKNKNAIILILKKPLAENQHSIPQHLK
jgi:hypothetical protein